MKNSLRILFFSFLAFSAHAHSHGPYQNSFSAGFLPENVATPRVSVFDKEKNKVTEQDFYYVTGILQRLYAAAIHNKGKVKLIINANWEDENVNAYATREVDSWSVHISGGMARAKHMTKESLALVVCHEIGHHLGGAPRSFLYGGWPSAEGQADYWATSKCLKKYYSYIPEDEVILDDSLPEVALRDCSSVYKKPLDFKVCVKTMSATLTFTKFLNGLPDVKIFASFLTPDKRQVKGTNTNDYPRPQCRVDTLYNGALCALNADVATSDSDDKIGHCNDHHKLGTRPRCWHRP